MNELKKNTSMKPALLILAGILYLLSPIDLIPDCIPLFGTLDDLGVIAFLIQRYNAYKQQADAQSLESTIIDSPVKALK